MPPHESVHEMPMRWADLDSLNHVNNVVYLDYAAESRAALVGEGVVGAGEKPTCIAIDFLRPLLLSRQPLHIRSMREGAVLTQEISTSGSEVHAKVVTTFGDALRLETAGSSSDPYALRVRRSDIDACGSASPTKVFEYFQEARIVLLAELTHVSEDPGRFVVGRVDVAYGAPIGWRAEPYRVTSRLGRVGRSSMAVESQIVDGTVVHATCLAVLVGFDPATQRSRVLTEHEKEAITRVIPVG